MISEKKELAVKQQGEPTWVAPAEETEKGLYFLSNLDQNIAVIVQTVYCYIPPEKKTATGDAVEVIKDALAKVLVHYYPLAGRLTISSDGKLIVDCTGEGSAFVEAEADCDLDDVGDITKADPADLAKLVYTVPGAKNILEMPLTSFQVTKFKCGGFTLGAAVNHCMFDGIAAMEFFTSWAETARGAPLSSPPVLDRGLLRSRSPASISFPHHEFEEIELISGACAADDINREDILFRSFSFDLETLQTLKSKAVVRGGKGCTSFEALSAFVWRTRTAALRLPPDQRVKLLFAADIRSRLSPPLPKGYFGNGIVLTCAVSTAGELLSHPFSFAAGLVSDATQMVTDEYIRSAVDYFEMTRARPSLAASMLITNWSRLGFLDADFGWGTPAQVGPLSLPEKEVVLFLSQGKGKTGGIKVLLGLPSSAMATFQELVDGEI